MAIILLTLLPHPATAQIPNRMIPGGNWWHNCASLDMDFYNDRYYINHNTTCDGTTGTAYSGSTYGTNITNFITATGATFTRAGTNVTSTAQPFYLASPQSFISRASVTNNVTSTIAPFYTGASQSWVSRADGGNAVATYFDSTGTLQTAAAGTARNASYTYNGSAWVAQAANALTPQTISSITDSSSTATVTTGAAHGLSVGNSVTLSGNYPSNYNGTFTIASVPSSTTFTYTMTTDPGVNASQIGAYTTTATTPAVLVEPASTNYVTNSTMVGVVAGDGVERVNNNAFSNTSPNVCSGSVTSSTNTFSCSSGTAVTAQTISSISYSSTTATVTTSSAHGLAIGNVVTVSGASPANYNGVFIVTSVPSTTTFTYTMASSPGANATTVGSYTATTGGWAPSISGGTGSVTASAGSMTLTGDGTHFASIYQAVSTVVGQTYIVITIGNGTGIPNSYAGTSQTTEGGLGGQGFVGTSGNGASGYFSFTATSSITYIQVGNVGTTPINITSVSVQVGSLPTNPAGGFTGFSGGSTSGLGLQIKATGTEYGMNYIDVRFYGTTCSACTFFSMLFPSTTTASTYQYWSAYAYARMSPSSNNIGTSGLIFQAQPRFGNNCSTNTSALTSTLKQYTGTGCYIAPGTTSESLALNFYFSANTALDFTVRIYATQLEQSTYLTSFIPTSSGTAIRAADVYNQQPASYIDGTGTLNFTPANTARTNHNTTSPYASLGTLIEPAATNSIRNNMMVGAVAADGVERTNNGTFSTSGSNVCSGTDNSSGNALSCSNSTAVTAQSISTITVPNSTSTTATVTTGAAHNLAVGNIVTVSGAAPAAYNGSYMVASVPSSTTFTYTMITAPATNATTVGSYTATAGGWAGTVNGGTGSVTGASGSMTLTGDGTNAASVYEEIPTTSGYRYTIAVTTGSGNAVTVQAGTAIGGSTLLTATSIAASTTNSYQFTATGTTSYIQINNSSTTAASVTTVSVQSAGEFPTNWGCLGGSNIICKVAATGTETGISYVDIQFSGTALSTVFPYLQPENGCTAYAASTGAVISFSTYVKLSAGSLSNVSLSQQLRDKSSGCGDLSPFLSSPLVPTSANLATQFSTVTSTSSTFTNSSTAYIIPQIAVSPTVGSPVNFTLRIGMPQMEQSSYATSVIPTFGSAVTRTADVYNQPVGTYYNASGTLTTAANNAPRLDHSPTSNYAPQGILVEESRGNLVNYSSQYTGSNWSDNGAGAETINHATTAPDGTLAYSIAATANYKGWYYIGSSFSASTAYTISVFVKNVSGGSTVSIGSGSSCFGSGNAAATVSFNDITGAFSSVSAGITSYSAQQLANGWWRVNIVATTSSSCTAFNIQNYPLSGAVASENAFWGNQIEAGSFPTSYIPTSGSTVTRAAETFTVPTTAGGGSGWYHAGVGTLLAIGGYDQLGTGEYPGLADLYGSSGNSISLYTNSSGNKTATIYAGGGSAQFSTQAGSNYVAGNVIRQSVAYATNSANAAMDGFLGTAGTSVTIPTVTELDIGADSGNFYGAKHVRRITYFPIRNPDGSLPQF